MAADATIVTGRRVADRYRLVEPRGDTAWDAIDETLKRNVVVHVLRADADEAAKSHFTAEARTLARLNHRNVVATYDTGVDGDGTLYRVDELGGRPVDLHAVDNAHRLLYARQITQALSDAHGVGLVHGAMTSANVLVDDDGRLQVRGFRLTGANDDVDAAARADVDALVALIVGLAPPGEAPLRDVAVGWRTNAPNSAAAMLDALAAIDDGDLAVPEPLPTPATGVPPVGGRRQRRALIVGLAAVAAAAVAAAVVLPTRGNSNFGGPVQAIGMTAKSFDPDVTPPTENEAEARLAVDRVPATGWSTDLYRSANFGNLKEGLGLILQPQTGAAEYTEIAIESPTRGWDVQIFVAEQPSATLAGWGKPVASASVRGAVTTLALPTRPSGGALLVWIPDPGANRQVRINEVTVQGRA